MLWFNCRVTVGKYVFPTFHSVEISESWRAIGDTATVRLPGLKKKLEDMVKTGEAIKVEMGYNGRYDEEFSGYVAEILPNMPFELKCEDESYHLKRQQVAAKAWKSVQLKEVLQYIIGSRPLQIKVPDITLAPFRLDKMTRYKALEKIKDEYGLTIYFRGKMLFVGLAYTENNANDQVIYHLQKNVVKPDLTYKRKEDVLLKVQAISLLPNNTKIKVDVGDEGGDSTTLHFYNITSEAKLKELAIEKLGKLKYEGYRGSITTFGWPRVKHGMVAVIRDDDYPQRQDRVFVDEVVKRVTKTGGYRREVKLGRRAN